MELWGPIAYRGSMSSEAVWSVFWMVVFGVMVLAIRHGKR